MTVLAPSTTPGEAGGDCSVGGRREWGKGGWQAKGKVCGKQSRGGEGKEGGRGEGRGLGRRRGKGRKRYDLLWKRKVKGTEEED